MKSRISFFNPTAFRKNLTRFAPAWVLYGVFLLLCMIMMADAGDTGAWFAYDVAVSTRAMVALNACYALLCAQLLFGDLYNSRMCNALHAMPMTREGWFFTNVVSGFAFSLLPNAVATLFSMFFAGNFMVVPLLWLAACTLQFAFFFGTAVLAAYCTGNRFAMVVIYGIINGFSVIAYWLVEKLFVPMLYGFEITEDIFLLLCPVAKQIMHSYIEVENISSAGTASIVLGDGWGYLGICAVLGVVCIGLGLLAYRKRNLEHAGEFVTVRWLSPVFLVLYSLCASAVCHVFFYIFVGEDSVGFLLVGITIGVFTGRMLLDRTVRVFKKRTFVIYGIIVGAFAASLLLTWLDPLGITRWVPKAEQVQSVSIYTGAARYYEDSDNYRFTDKDQIEDILKLHTYGVEHRNAGANGKEDTKLFLTYRMKNGLTHKRYYYVDIDTDAGALLNTYMSSPEIVLGITEDQIDAYTKKISRVSGEFGEITDREKIESLLQAVLLDCKAGTMSRDGNFNNGVFATWITLQSQERDVPGGLRYTYWDLRVSEKSVNTLAWLEENDLKLDKDIYVK